MLARVFTRSALFALTLATSAAMLFAVQPLVARLALPTLGGTPGVWNACMVFFQAAVLAGYALAHQLAARTCRPVQAGVFLVLIVLGSIRLPIRLSADAAAAAAHPVSWLLSELARGPGLPALALAVASPLLQRWFATGAAGEREPYFLYAASNIGSLGALLAYPLLVEPLWTLEAQARGWKLAYGTWGLLVALCAAVMLRGGAGAGETCSSSGPTVALNPAAASPSKIGWATWARWVGLAAIPAMLLQGCTLYLTTDVASVPLLWVVPLALYLATFVVAFGARGGGWIRAGQRLQPFLGVALLYLVLMRATQPVLVLMGLHLAYLVVAGMVCHGRLVALRPPAEQLTGFYLAMAVGGVLGGAFCSLLAPRIFTSVAEYPIAIALACVALPPRAAGRHAPASPAQRRAANWGHLSWALAIGMLVIVCGLVLPWLVGNAMRARNALVFAPAAIACCTLLDRPVRLALAMAATFAAGAWLHSTWSGDRHAERNFFGITRVTEDTAGGFRQLVHGNTFHGRQFLDAAQRHEPLTYYHREGPLGRLMAVFQNRDGARRIGVIGLGAGSMAAYARPEEDWTFYEIDPAVIRVARDPRWFSYLTDCRAREWRVVEGDARLRLGEAPDGAYDLVVLDAFSSDAIPVHLLTREALALYRRTLAPGGWLAVHISNRYLNLEPLVASLARETGWVCRSSDDATENDYPGKEASHWLVLARTEKDLGRLAKQSVWAPAEGAERVTPWTDQRASVLEVFDWH